MSIPRKYSIGWIPKAYQIRAWTSSLDGLIVPHQVIDGNRTPFFYGDTIARESCPIVLRLEVRTIGHGTSWIVSSRERRELRRSLHELVSAVSLSRVAICLAQSGWRRLGRMRIGEECEMSSILSDASTGLRHWLSSLWQFGGGHMSRAVPKVVKRVGDGRTLKVL